MFFDEYQNYRGTAGQQTQAFQFLDTVRGMVRRVMAIGLSADVGRGPQNWRPFVNHALNTTGAGPIPGIDNSRDLDRYQASFDYLVNNLDRDQVSDQRREERNNRRQELLDFVGEFIPAMMVARTRTSEFLGKPLGDAYGRIRMKKMDMQDGTHQDFKSLVARIRSYIDRQYDESMRRWEADGQQGEKPNKKDMYREISENRRANDEYAVISRASCFPGIATLYSRGLIERGSILVNDFESIAANVSQLLGAGPRDAEAVDNIIQAVDDEFDKSPFIRHRGNLRLSSGKILWVEKYIQEMIRILNVSPDPRTSPDAQAVFDRFGPAPPDGTNARHVLIFSDAPISAFLTMMILWDVLREEFRKGNIVLLYAHSGVPTRVRSQYADFIRQSCAQDNRCKVLISTNAVYGEGHNLQRANTVILTEVPSTYERQKQSFGRVDRQGQTMQPFLFQLHDSRNLAESIKLARNKNRRRVLRGDADDPTLLDIEDRFDNFTP
ncbi:hypothetical protein F4859DRAFT_512404 [Xylaria cf. heliscus]|nr:hypothetical protein F4859DRAFT_512404 [Xylaria cf. heliscus]